MIEERFGTSASLLTSQQLFELYQHTKPEVQEAKYQIAILEQELSELRNALRKLKPQSQKENEFAPIKVFEAEPKVSLSDSLFDSQGDYNPIYHQRRQEPTQFS